MFTSVSPAQPDDWQQFMAVIARNFWAGQSRHKEEFLWISFRPNEMIISYSSSMVPIIPEEIGLVDVREFKDGNRTFIHYIKKKHFDLEHFIQWYVMVFQ